MNQIEEDYNLNVFINCPFDTQYAALFNAMVFTIIACGFIPRCAKEEDDSDEIRIQKIVRLIGNSKYGIHDLSRVDTSAKLPRFNMPLELGIFMGCLHFGSDLHSSKKYLILESEEFRFRQFISDLSGQDIKSHNGDERQLITCVRDWLSRKTRKRIPHASRVAEKYGRFNDDLPQLCELDEWTVSELTFLEYCGLASAWLRT
ncbi:MAG: hypothetical protein LH606_11910 [Cytophagaceae bacterium]|nr:hypothetical protein [Cytophagaceae bacterium]